MTAVGLLFALVVLGAVAIDAVHRELSRPRLVVVASPAPTGCVRVLRAAARTCRVCGCTEDRACPGGCWWVTDPLAEGDLCSACEPAVVA